MHCRLYYLGDSYNRFAFTGYEEDKEAGLLYAKARFYDPDTGKFLSEDAWEGDKGKAPSLHRYLYGYQNPTVYVDRDGNEPTVIMASSYLAHQAYKNPDKSKKLARRFTNRLLDHVKSATDQPKAVRELGQRQWNRQIENMTTPLATADNGRVKSRSREVFERRMAEDREIVQQTGKMLASPVLAANDFANGNPGSGVEHVADALITYAPIGGAPKGSPKIKPGNTPAGLIVEDLSYPAPAKNKKPGWLLRLEEGNEFNSLHSPSYPYNEVYVRKANSRGHYRLDSYNPGKNEIVSRKHTQLADVQGKTALKYVHEIEKKYPVGAEISDVPTNVENGLVGQRLQGQYVLEVPPQKTKVPKKVSKAADKARVVIREVDDLPKLKSEK